MVAVVVVIADWHVADGNGHPFGCSHLFGRRHHVRLLATRLDARHRVSSPRGRKRNCLGFRAMRAQHHHRRCEKRTNEPREGLPRWSSPDVDHAQRVRLLEFGARNTQRSRTSPTPAAYPLPGQGIHDAVSAPQQSAATPTRLTDINPICTRLLSSALPARRAADLPPPHFAAAGVTGPGKAPRRRTTRRREADPGRCRRDQDLRVAVHLHSGRPSPLQPYRRSLARPGRRFVIAVFAIPRRPRGMGGELVEDNERRGISARPRMTPDRNHGVGSTRGY